MAKVDVKSPSEDEDFDVKADGDTGSEDAANDTSATQDVTTATESASEEAPADVNLSPEESEPAAKKDTEAESETEVEQESEAASPASDPEPETTPEPKAKPVAATPTTPKKSGSTGRVIFEIILIAIIIGLGVWGWGLRSDRSNLEAQVAKLNANPQAIVQKQAQDLINRVSKLMQLPTGEQPTIANVSDASQAKKQSAFFNNAQNGDKVLMYVKAGEAILYRPSTNKIILVAPLTFNSAATGSTPATTTPAATSSKPNY